MNSKKYVLLMALVIVKSNLFADSNFFVRENNLLNAVFRGQTLEVMRILTNPEADPNTLEGVVQDMHSGRLTENTNRWTALMWAAFFKHSSIIKLLLAHPETDPSLKGQTGTGIKGTALDLAKMAHKDNNESIILLENALALWNTKNDSRQRANPANAVLLQAIQNNDLQGVKTAFSKTADVNARDSKNNMTPLMLAAYRINPQFLSKSSTQTLSFSKNDTQDLMRPTPAQQRILIIEELLRQKDIDANLTDRVGWTVLMRVANNGATDVHQEYCELTRNILAHPKTDANIKDSEGKTALIYAAEYGRIDLVKTFLANERVNPTLVNHLGLGALDYALISAKPDQATLIKKMFDSAVEKWNKSQPKNQLRNSK